MLACVLVCVMLASLVVVMRVALVLAQPAGRWRAAGRIGLEHCDAGAGARWLGARSLLDHGARAQRYAESGVVQPSVWCGTWGAMVRCCVVLGCGDEGAGAHSLGERCLRWGARWRRA